MYACVHRSEHSLYDKRMYGIDRNVLCNLACFDSSSVTPDMEHVLQKVVLAQPDAVQVTIGQVCWCCWCTRL